MTADRDLIEVALTKETWDVVLHALEEEMAQLEPEAEWLGKYPEEGGVTAMGEAHQEITQSVRGQ